MSAAEILSIAFGLFVGYWVVSRLVLGEKKTKQSATQGDSASETSEPAAWHEVLKVDSGATVDEIHAAYQSRIRQYQPDSVAYPDEEMRALADKRLKAVEAAYREALKARGAG
jgi:DnaJ-domain-containing protein 1